MAHTKAQRAVRGNRDSRSKRLGVKVFGGQAINAGGIIIKQRGSRVKAGDNVMISKDFSLIALKKGTVQFLIRNGKKYVTVI